MRKPFLSLCLPLCLLLSACSGGQSRDTDYGDTSRAPSLIIPPGMGSPDTGEAMPLPELGASEGGAASKAAVLPEVKGVRIVREGGVSWMQVDESVEALWPRLQSFWKGMGLTLLREEPELGLMETGWSENQRDLPDTWLRGVVPGLYSASLRDKYRLRLQRDADGGSEIFLSHYRMEEVTTGETSTQWQTRPADKERLAELQRRLLMHLGVPKAQAETMQAQDQVQAQEAVEAAASRTLLQSGALGLELRLNEGFARAWRHTGIGLDSMGLVIDDRNRSQGLFYVSVIGMLNKSGRGGGLLASWFGSDDDEQSRVKRLVLLQGDGDEATLISLLDENGAVLSDEQSRPLLELLAEQLN